MSALPPPQSNTATPWDDPIPQGGKILVIRLGAMGDLIHVSPSVAALAQNRPDCEIHVLTSPMYQSMVERFPGVHTVHCWKKAKGFTGWANWQQTLKTLKPLRFDGVINLHPALQSHLLVWLLGVPSSRLVQYRKEKLKVFGQQQRELHRFHAVENFFQPFQTLFPSLQDEVVDLAPVLPTQGLSLPSPLTENTPYVALLPGVGGKRGNRAWFAHQWGKLIDTLLDLTEVTVLLVGGPDEESLATTLQQRSAQPQRVIPVCGAHTILETAALLSQCEAAIGGDTGPLHVAAAVGTPTIGLFGPTSVARTGPRGADDHIIHTLTPPEDMACWPCEESRCPLDGEEDRQCMLAISPIAVKQALTLLKPGLFRKELA